MMTLLADVTLSNNTLIGIAIGVFTLLGLAGAYIRREAGVRDVQKVEVNEPLTMRTEIEFVPVHDFKKFEKYVHEREHLIRDDLQAMQNAQDLRRAESAEQFDDLREKLDVKFNEAMRESNSSASKVHKRIDDLATTSGEMRGEMRQVNENINRLMTVAMTKKS